MRIILVVIFAILGISNSLSAQNKDLILVKSGTKILDYFPFRERYEFPEFRDGKLVYKNGMIRTGRFNYNILTGEMDFVQPGDTLAFSNKKDISMITVALDTFFYDNGYIELISHGPVRIGLKQRVLLKEILRKGAYGVTDRNSAIDTYTMVEAGGNFYKLTPNEDWLLERSRQYVIKAPSGDYVQLNRKNLFEIFPLKKDSIKEYLKLNRVDFQSPEDLLKLADFLGTLPDKPTTNS